MIGYEYADLFNEDSVDKQLILEFSGGETITNEDIYSESMSIEEGLCSENDLVFGSCEASLFKIKIANSFKSHKGQTLKVTVVLNEHKENPFLLGIYKVRSDKPTADRRCREIVAYDAMYDILNTDVADWYNGLFENGNITLNQFKDSFFEHLGIEQEETELVNNNITVSKTISPTVLSGKEVITAICQINGVFGHITRNGKFKYVRLNEISTDATYPSDSVLPSDDLFPSDSNLTKTIDLVNIIDCQYEDFTVNRINRVDIREDTDDLGASYGSGDNIYVLQGNFLAYGLNESELQEIAKNLLSVIGKVSYIPAEVNIKGNPCYEVGEPLRIGTRYKVIYTYMLHRTLTGIQSLKDNYVASGTEDSELRVNSIESQITQLKGKSNRLTRSIEETRSEITDVEKGLMSTITQTADGLRKEYEDSANGLKHYVDETAEGTYESVSKNFQSIDAMSSYPTKVEMSHEIDTKVDSTTETFNQKISDLQGQLDKEVSTYFFSGVPTLENEPANEWVAKGEQEKHIGDLYYDKETSAGYRFLRDDTNGSYSWQVIADEQAMKALDIANQANELAKSVGEDLSSNYSTTVEMNSQITKSIDGFKSEVSANYQSKDAMTGYPTSAEMKSAIDQSASSIESSVSANYTSKERTTTLESRIAQTVKNIALTVSNNDTTAGITITLENEDGTKKTLNGTIDMTGLVNFNDLAGAGTTTINGANIKTGSINCDRLNGGEIKGQRATLTKLYVESNQEGHQMRLLMDSLGYGFVLQYYRPEAEAWVNLATSTLTSSMSGSFGLDIPVISGTTTVKGRGYFGGAVCPEADGGTSLGTGSYRWSTVFAKNKTINTSDERQKKNIEDIDSRYEELFFKLEPKTFMFNDGDRIHIGTTAQRLKKTMDELGLSNEDMSAYCEDLKMKSEYDEEKKQFVEVPELDENGNEQYTYGIRYGEFIMLNTHMLQKAYKRIEELETRLSKLESEVNKHE